MQIEQVDFFYLSMPEVLDIGDGSQDVLLVRLQAGDHVGWGECEASPLVSIASLVAPMSHSACKPVRASVLGQRLDDVADIARIGDMVRAESMDMLQADHTLSGIDMAMWDLLGQRLDAPAYQLLGYPAAFPKRPYASQLFGDTPQETLRRAQATRADGYTAAKFGWGPFGLGAVADDVDQLAAAREGLGDDCVLLVDAGTVWGEDVARAAARLDALAAAGALFLEEPFVSGAHAAYRALRARSGAVGLAGGEGAHNYHLALHMMDNAGIDYVQIDTGRIGGISPAKRVADAAVARGITYLNHTFTSHLALVASLTPFAGLAAAELCEYPVAVKPVSWELTREHVLRGDDGLLRLPEAPGLGLAVDEDAVARYLVDVEIKVGGRDLYRTPAVGPDARRSAASGDSAPAEHSAAAAG